MQIYFLYVLVSQLIPIYHLFTSITAEGWTKLVSLHIVYVSAPSFIYHTSCLSITIALKSRHPDDPAVANSSSCSEGAVQNTYTKTKENLAHFQHVLGPFLQNWVTDSQFDSHGYLIFHARARFFDRVST